MKLVEIRPHDKPWFTSKLRTAIRVRERLRKKALKTKNVHDQQKYKTQRNKVSNMKKIAKTLYFEKINDTINETKTNDPKSYWKIMKAFMKKNDVANIIPPLKFRENGLDELVFSDEEKCNVLNNYFCSVTHLEENDKPLPPFPKRCNTVLDVIQITSQEIEKTINSLPLNKACGPDKIHHKLLKSIAKEISHPLKILFQRSLYENRYPKVWKEAFVIPIYKKGDKTTPANYRPISLLSCVGKLFERIIFQHIFQYLVDNNLLYDYQSGFIPGHSTVHQLIEIYDHICKSLDNKDLNCLAFCDVSKAFDRVWHRGLLLKLEVYGISGNLLSWFSSYISNRSQKVCYKNSTSSAKFTHAGVPQGSVLGPLLFLLYINDIADDIQGLARLFADDTSVGNISRDLPTVIRNTNSDLSKINTWAKIWLVKFNPPKTDIVIFTNKTIDTLDNNLEFDSEKLAHVDQHKHLGVTFQANGKWSTHIDNIIHTAGKQLNVLRKVKYQLKRENLSKLYTVFIRPVLEYASEVWSNCSECDSNRLERVQLQAARIVTGLPIYASKAALYFETGWEPLESRRKRKCLCQMYNIVNNKSPGYLQSLMPPTVANTIGYDLRNSANITVPYTRLNIYQKSFFPATIKLWNELEEGIKVSPNLSIFKRKITENRVISPKSFSFGDRKCNIIHTKLRHGCSQLNSDLYRVHLLQSPLCECGDSIEDVTHFFLHCTNYTELRRNILPRIRSIMADITVENLLYGHSDLSFGENCTIFLLVHKFIKDSHRFD